MSDLTPLSDVGRATIGDTCEILDSQRRPVTAKDRLPGPYPYYGANGVQDYVNDYLFDDELVLLAEDGGHFGSKTKPIAYRVSGKCWVNNHAHVLKPKEGLDVDYLCYSLMYYDVGQYVNGATRQKLNQSDMRKLMIPLRNKSEQCYIVSVLDMTLKQIERLKSFGSGLDNLIKSRFVEMFGGLENLKGQSQVYDLSELIDLGFITYHLDGNHGNDYPRSSEFVSDGVPYIGANCIIDGSVSFGNSKYLTSERAKRIRKGKAIDGDVLFAHNASVGPVAILRTKQEMVILSTSLTAYRCDRINLLPEYLCAYMKSWDFITQYERNMKQTTRNQVPITAQRRFLFIVPEIVQQQEFAAFVQQVDKSKVAVQKAIDKLELLKASLMQEYFG